MREMTLKRAKNYFHLGQQELEDFKGGEAQFIVELIIEAQARIMNLLAAGFEISTKKQPKQLEFLRWWNDGNQRETKVLYDYCANRFKTKRKIR